MPETPPGRLTLQLAFVAVALIVPALALPGASADHLPVVYYAKDHACVTTEGRHVTAACSVEETLYTNLTVPEPVPERAVDARVDTQRVVASADGAPVPALDVDLAALSIGDARPHELLLGFHYATAPWTDPALTDAERDERAAKAFTFDVAESTGMHVRLLCGWDLTETERVCAFYNPEADAETALVRAHRDAVVADGTAAVAASAGATARENAPAVDVQVGVERVEARAATTHAADGAADAALADADGAHLSPMPADRDLAAHTQLTPRLAPTPPLARDGPAADAPPAAPASPGATASPGTRVLGAMVRAPADAPGAALAHVSAAVGAGAFVTLLTVLAHRYLSRRNVLGNATREAVFAAVTTHAGATITDVARAVRVRHTTATYHLDVLAEMGLVTSERVGNRKHYFPAASHRDRTHRITHVLKAGGRARRVWDLLQARDAARAADLADAAGMTPSGVLWHLKRLEGLGLAESETDGRGRIFRARTT